MKKFCRFIGYLVLIFGALALIYDSFFKDKEKDEDNETVPLNRDYITLDME